MQNTVVVHFPGGKLLKGVTNNFFPNKARFHLTLRDTGEVVEVPLSGIKAVFFVKGFDGNAEYQDRADTERTGLGRKLQVEFNDGEVLVGYSQGYAPNRQGFFVFPVDPDSNNDRIFVMNEATSAVQFL
jgi:hypothetical protein